MKRRGLGRVRGERRRRLDRRGTRTDRRPPVAYRLVYREPTVCDACGAVYTRKTWRRSRRRRLRALLEEADWARCPACRQVREGRSYGRVLLRGEWFLGHQEDVRRRVVNVEARARYTQPLRRLVAMGRSGETLEVTTTSQKLAHRVVHELQKAFGGRASYSWSQPDGRLTATLARD
jgi:hypothetical protein